MYRTHSEEDMFNNDDPESTLTPTNMSHNDEPDSDPQLFESEDYMSQRHYNARIRRKKLSSRKHQSEAGRRYIDSKHHSHQKEPSVRDDTSSLESLDDLGMTSRNLPEEVEEVYLELQAISDRLKRESKILQEREFLLREKERLIDVSQKNVKSIAAQEVNRRWKEYEEQHKAELSRMEELLKEKTRENKRLKDNFDTVKQANETLRHELETLQEQHEKLEKQAMSTQARMVNLHRKMEFATRQKDVQVITTETAKLKANKENKESKTQPRSVLKPTSNTYDVLTNLLEWVSESHLRSVITHLPSNMNTSTEVVQDKCYKLLPSLVEILREIPQLNVRNYLPSLQFIYWSLLHIEQGQVHMKTALSSTLRRLGEELYRPKSVRFTDDNKSIPQSPAKSPQSLEKSRENLFFRSSDEHIRFLSGLLVLKTLTQVDQLAHVFDVLRSDLKTESTRQLYLHYVATPAIIPYLKPTNQALLTCAVDIFLQMSMDSPTLPYFLESCSNEHWFRACSMVLRTPNLPDKITEKLSIILQKLSKIKSNRKFFEVFTITGMVQETIRKCTNQNAFLALNMKSILVNLNVRS